MMTIDFIGDCLFDILSDMPRLVKVLILPFAAAIVLVFIPFAIAELFLVDIWVLLIELLEYLLDID